MQKWKRLYTYFVDNYQTKQIHILRFENLKTNLEDELQHLMDFLGLKFDRNLTACIMKRQNGFFKRPKSNIDYKKFYTNVQKIKVENIRKQVYAKLGIVWNKMLILQLGSYYT